MKWQKGIIVLWLFLIGACASVEQPKPDPVKEQLIILQKQFLELQKLQNETKARLDESATVIDTLSLRLRTLEQRQPMLVAGRFRGNSKSAIGNTDKKMKPPTKKKGKRAKRKIRRQE